MKPSKKGRKGHEVVTLESADLKRAVSTTVRESEPAADVGEPPPPTPLMTKGRMVSDGLVGRGGMGAVHRVYDRNIRRYAAMKVLDEEVAALPKARRRFLAEAQITGQLEHPNIVPVYDLELTESGAPHDFTMKLVDGETLTRFILPERVAARTDAETWELLNVFLKVCDAIAYAHSRGVVHRDLKPDNVMMGPFGQVYVVDWGIARATGAACGGLASPEEERDRGLAIAHTTPPPVRIDASPDGEDDPVGTVTGTYPYMAPEQAWGRTDEIDGRTDVFALGAILYQLLTGRAPYRAASPPELAKLARAGIVQPPAEAVAGFVPSPALSAIAMKALAPAREDRYPSVTALQRDVERALRGGLSLAPRTFAEGTVILREGDAADAAYIITQGRCEAYKGVRGEGTRLREMGPGEVFGEMALLSSRPRSASVVALEEVTAIVVTPEALAREVHAESWLVPLLKTLVDRFRELDERTSR